jgi:hypothetical protein
MQRYKMEWWTAEVHGCTPSYVEDMRSDTLRARVFHATVWVESRMVVCRKKENSPVPCRTLQDNAPLALWKFVHINTCYAGVDTAPQESHSECVPLILYFQPSKKVRIRDRQGLEARLRERARRRVWCGCQLTWVSWQKACS